MGIPFYFSYIIKNHPEIIIKLEDSDVEFEIDNFYLDCNSIIYDIIHTTDAEKLSNIDLILQAVCQKIDAYIHLIKPTKNIYIAFDGVAPVAKLEQQRSRRFKSMYQTNLTRTFLKDKFTDPWNTSAITPGTFFMNQLNAKIYATYNDPTRFHVENIIVSGSDEYGEGEHKLFQYIRENPEEHKEQITVVYGLDADLIMLAINHLSVISNLNEKEKRNKNGIYLFRETPHFIASINSDLEPNKNYILDIPKFSNFLSTENNLKTPRDYIFLCFLLGNDFMPHFPAINIRTGGIDKLINSYKFVFERSPSASLIVDDININWKNFNKLIEVLAKNEEEWLKNEKKLRDKKERSFEYMNSTTPEDQLKKLDSIPMYDRSVEKYIDPYKSGWQDRYYTALFSEIETTIDENIKKEICINYLEGLEWTLKYYSTNCPDWRWKYKYNYPPLLCDLVKYIPNKSFFKQLKEPRPVSPLLQLCYVLPRQSLHLLPGNLQQTIMTKYEHLYKTYSDCEFIWAYCRYFWEAHVLLPEIDIALLEKELIENIENID